MPVEKKKCIICGEILARSKKDEKNRFERNLFCNVCVQKRMAERLSALSIRFSNSPSMRGMN